jgi:hypothetical protein
MKITITTAFALLLATAAVPALAATTTNATTPAPSNSATNTNSPEATNLRQQMQNDLSKAGFTDIKIMPESYLIRAKDSHGNPVMMVINPDSFTELTAVAPKSGATANSASNSTSSSAETPAKK